MFSCFHRGNSIQDKKYIPNRNQVLYSRSSPEKAEDTKDDLMSFGSGSDTSLHSDSKFVSVYYSVSKVDLALTYDVTIRGLEAPSVILSDVPLTSHQFTRVYTLHLIAVAVIKSIVKYTCNVEIESLGHCKFIH